MSDGEAQIGRLEQRAQPTRGNKGRFFLEEDLEDRLPVDPDVLEGSLSSGAGGKSKKSQLVRLGAVALGGFFGSIASYFVELVLPPKPGGFPWATFGINTSGAFLLGLVMVLVAERWRSAPPLVRHALCVGFLGSWTTMSTFALETVQLVRDGDIGSAAVYVAATLGSGLAAAALGIVLARTAVTRQEVFS